MPRQLLRRLRILGLEALKYCPAQAVSVFVWWTHAKFLIAVAVVAFRNDQVLLLRHRYRPRHPWGLITGFVDRGETLEQAALREITEETGIVLSSDQHLRCVQMGFVRPRHFEVVYSLEDDAAFPDSIGTSWDGEIESGAWHALQHLPRGMLDSQIALIRQVEATRRTGPTRG